MTAITATIFIMVLVCFFPRNKRRLDTIALYCYAFSVLIITIIARENGVYGQVNLVPLKQVIIWGLRYYNAFGLLAAFRPIVGLYLNVLLFIPIGFFMHSLSIWKVVLFSVIFSLNIELIQLITRLGMFETDDLIMNVLGSIIGVKLYKRGQCDDW